MEFVPAKTDAICNANALLQNVGLPTVDALADIIADLTARLVSTDARLRALTQSPEVCEMGEVTRARRALANIATN
jgi:hypothetical protein